MIDQKLSALALSGILVILIFVGAGVLQAFEHDTELKNCEIANDAIAKIIEKSARLSVQLPDDVRTETKISEDLRIMTESNFNNVFAKAYEIHLANPNLLTVYDSVTKNWTCPDNWSFGNSIWNAGTMIFSLGFRFTAPVTFGAMDFKIFLNPLIRRLFCAFYLLFGVPLFFMTMFLLANQMVSQTIGPIVKLTKAAQISGIIGYSMLMILLCSLVPASILYKIENMELFDAWYFCITSITTVGFGDIRLTGVANAIWLIWLLFSIVNSFAVAILIFRRLTLTKLQKSNLEDEQTLLQNQTDGPVNYGNGFQYNPTLMPVYDSMLRPPPVYNEKDYQTLSTIQVRPVDPQMDLSLDIESEKETVSDQKPKKVEQTIEHQNAEVHSKTPSITEDDQIFGEVKPLVPKN